MSGFKFNYDFLKKNATPGSWRRGYEYYQKDMILESYPEKNFFKGKVKGNYQDFYVTDLIFKKNKNYSKVNCSPFFVSKTAIFFSKYNCLF